MTHPVRHGWCAFYPAVKEPWPTFPMIGYFIEHSDKRQWPEERCKALLSFWLGEAAIPEDLR